ncbi:hypothetical protein OE88DRAFT_1736974 [Heliocybe sulcata]|uniref:Uncharacterized protein n=1 Tax=Heliocybe sulcata TaxID=5364 RepID=A0A5C3MVI9_9AGAM|nr:hypothetical protein OE88DRAFT_1736974 [Heliocybe sulcata]
MRLPAEDEESEGDGSGRQSRPLKAARKLGGDTQGRLGRKAAKKHKAISIYESEDSSEEPPDQSGTDASQDTVETLPVRKGKASKATKTARSSGVPQMRYNRAQSEDPLTPQNYEGDATIPLSSRASPVMNGFAVPHSILLAVNSLPLSSGRLRRLPRLPFLRRNLRRVFAYKCGQIRDVDAPKFQEHGEGPIEVVYRLQVRDDLELLDEIGDAAHDHKIYEEYRAAMDTIQCPICDLHGAFSVLYPLKRHLDLDHPEVYVTWELSAETRKIILLIPHLPVDYEQTSSSPEESTTSESDAQDMDVHERPIAPSPSLDPGRSEAVSTEGTVETSPFHLKLKLQPKYHASYSPTASSQAPSVAAINLGPAAQFPYLPQGNSQFSCRPGGPRLYDLLNTLPMDRFGIMSWFIIDKEEEMFELDDVRDEDKVMMALWARWILLNRNEFIRDYFQGTLAFVDEYWEMIKLAAGWSALRVWLLMLVANRFLEGSHVAKVLKHYEQLADTYAYRCPIFISSYFEISSVGIESCVPRLREMASVFRGLRNWALPERNLARILCPITGKIAVDGMTDAKHKHGGTA